MTTRKIINRRKALKITAYLTGGAISATLATGLLSCQTDSATSGTSDNGGMAATDWKPSFLSAPQNKTLIEATERILPATDTPGAKAAQVNQFIDIMGKDIISEEEKLGLKAGLDQLEADAQAAHSKSFADCSDSEMDAIITATAENNKPFFQGLRELTILGFYTSEIGAKTLAYDKIPTEYKGCIPFEEVGKTWAL